MINNTYILGDVHGNLNALMSVLSQADFHFENDKLIFLGDVYDGYAPVYSSACVEIFRTMKKFVWVLGNHDCNHKDTEYLTNNGWKIYPMITEDDLVAQFDIQTGDISFVKPLARIEKYSETLIRIEGRHTLQCVTPNHDVVIEPLSGLRKGIWSKVKAKELTKETSYRGNIRISGNIKERIKIDISQNMLSLLTWVVCDGSIVMRNEKPHHIQFKLSKDRKIKSLTSLLNSLDVNFTLQKATVSGINKLQPYVILIYGQFCRDICEHLNNKKGFPQFFRDLNKEDLMVVLKTVEETDGHTDKWGRTDMVSISWNNISLLQEAMIRNGRDCILSPINNTSGFKNGKQQYRLSFWLDRKPKNLGTLKISEIDYKDTVYCFQMPLGTLITRFEGKVAFTGNCWVRKWFRTGWGKGAYITWIAKIADIDNIVSYDVEGMVWIEQGGYNTIKDYEKNTHLIEIHKEFIEKSVIYYIDDNNNLYVHGGYDLNFDIDKQPKKDIYYWDRDLYYTALKNTNFYIREYNKVFTGHTALKEPYKPFIRDNFYNLDTGAGNKNGKLTLMNVETGEYFQS